MTHGTPTPALLALIALACGPALPMTTEGGTGSSTTTTGSATSTGGTTTGTLPTTATGAISSTSTDPTSTDTTINFIQNPDYGGCAGAAPGESTARCTQCDPWVQDCPPDEKCTPYSGDGDHDWDTVKCAPIPRDPAQVGEPCIAEGHQATGIDTCDVGAMCWDVDPDTLEGTCVGFCEGTPDAPTCPEGLTCVITHSGVLVLCLPSCNPIVPDCKAGELCIPVPTPTLPTSFYCTPDLSGSAGQPFDPCAARDACDPGHFCADPSLATECDPDAPGCCIPYCVVNIPNTCPGAMQECLPWFEPNQAPAGLDALGFCGLPE